MDVLGGFGQLWWLDTGWRVLRVLVCPGPWGSPCHSGGLVGWVPVWSSELCSPIVVNPFPPSHQIGLTDWPRLAGSSGALWCPLVPSGPLFPQALCPPSSGLPTSRPPDLLLDCIGSLVLGRQAIDASRLFNVMQLLDDQGGWR